MNLDRLVHGIGGSDGIGSVGSRFRRISKFAHRHINSADYCLHRQQLTDQTGGAHTDLHAVGQAECLRDVVGHLLGVTCALLARAGVRSPGVQHDGTDSARGEVCAGKMDGSSGDAVGGKDCCRGAKLGRSGVDDEGDVTVTAGFDPCVNP